MKDDFSTFKAELAANILITIAVAKHDGIVGMSEQNLLMLTPTPKAPGPIGSNMQWVYAQMFQEIIDRLPAATKSFITERMKQ